MKNLCLALIVATVSIPSTAAANSGPGEPPVAAGFSRPEQPSVAAGFSRLEQTPVVAGFSRPEQTADASTIFELVLRDGSRIFGTVVRNTDQEVVFKTSSGATLTAAKADVVSLRRVKGRLSNGEFVRSDEHRSRLFFAPTARSLEKGQVSVGVFQFLAPFVQVGVTDRFSVGGGTPLIFGLDEDSRPFWVTPKMQVYNGDSAKAAVGVLHLFGFDGHSAGIGYGVTTFGSTDDALTVGAGVAYSGDDQGGVVMIGGERRVRRNLKLITENYVWNGGEGFVSGGVRFIGERLSADLALAIPFGMGDLFAFPVVNFVYVF